MAARIARAERPDRPVILVTGALGDDAAAELLKAGISDYVLKDHLARLRARSQLHCAMPRRHVRAGESRLRTMSWHEWRCR